MEKFALLVGNGFSFDLVQSFGLDSSFPLQYFKNEEIKYNSFLHRLPGVQSELFQQLEEVNDFESIEKFLNSEDYNDQKDCELRRFLSLAYSHFQIKVEQNNLSQWKWSKWLQKNKKALNFAISFNYDVILEKVLKLSGIKYYRTGSTEITKGVPVFKPHGSLDFDLYNYSCPVELRWNIITSLNDTGLVQVVPKKEWPDVRFQADIIPPSKENYQKDLLWVNMGKDQYLSHVTELDSLVIVGSSYWDVDRPEIDFFLENLSPDAKVYIMNPNPSPELIETIRKLGLEYKTFEFHELPW
ncbi:hypothetical protein [Priestia megaterium]|uniref:hypothetical protein n=1 Tax=Priestia megaterium TaxID=1404 RepID=UPI002857C274|nr:hypothetical protein [Priestia megaterium]MDR7246325.1 hypothetical protein [Priestia megaterium]